MRWRSPVSRPAMHHPRRASTRSRGQEEGTSSCRHQGETQQVIVRGTHIDRLQIPVPPTQILPRPPPPPSTPSRLRPIIARIHPRPLLAPPPRANLPRHLRPGPHDHDLRPLPPRHLAPPKRRTPPQLAGRQPILQKPTSPRTPRW